MKSFNESMKIYQQTIYKSQFNHLQNEILIKTRNNNQNCSIDLLNQSSVRFSKTREFINYWLTKKTQIELVSLIIEIEKIDDIEARSFFNLVFSPKINTKLEKVSLPFDLINTKPHRAMSLAIKCGIGKLDNSSDDYHSPLIQFKSDYDDTFKE